MTEAPITPVPDAADGPRHILLTGATGFVGQAVLLALLERTDDTHVLAVVRSRPGQPAAGRLRALLDKAVFAPLVAARGREAVEREFDARVRVLDADLNGLEGNERAVEQLRALGSLHAAVHCASAVSFDLPIDVAFDTNVGGALGVYGALSAAGLDPHVVHVSTAYVGGSARGVRPEGPLRHRVDWRGEREWALAARHDAELASRTPAELGRHLRLARLVHGKEGPLAVAEAAERARREAVDERLVEAGFLRAQTLGWTDVYTFTKAMAERVAETEWAAAGHRLSVVRPSIIESSLAWPSPAWIDGFKVADPLIMAYGKGMLPAFPALPDSVLDLVPVDMVVAVILALATSGVRREGEDAYYQVVSGTSNPLPFHTMVDAVHDYFTEHPMTDERGRTVRVPTWKYRGPNLIEPLVAAQEKAVRVAELGASLVPRGTGARRWAGTLHRQRAGLTALRKYIDLYRQYTQTELVFDDAHTRELLAAVADQPDADRQLPFDVTVVDWRSYLMERHMPAVVELSEEYGRDKRDRREREAARADAPLAAAPGAIAVFDLDGTVSRSTVVTQYLSLLRDLRGPVGRMAEVAAMAVATPRYLAAERRDRAEFVRLFMRRYAGVRLEDLREAVRTGYAARLRASLRPEALERIRLHREAGHRTVLVTGVPAPLVEPLADLVDEVVATQLDVQDGVLTGYLAGPPLVDEARAAWLLRHARAHGVDLAASYGYGDSQADITWLALLGNPFAVGPDLGLYAEAKRHRWPILDWR